MLFTRCAASYSWDRVVRGMPKYSARQAMSPRFILFWKVSSTQSLLLNILLWPITEMQISGDLKSGDFSFITLWHRTTPPPPKKKEMSPPPHQIDLHAPKTTWVPILTLTLQREKGKKISQVIRGLPKLTQSWTEEDFSMLAQKIRKVS